MFDRYNTWDGGLGFVGVNNAWDGTMGLNWPSGYFDDFNGGGGIDWQSIINQGFGIGSQIIGAWGHNPTQQIGPGGMPIGQGYSPAAQLQAQAQLQQAIAQQNAQLYGNQYGGQGVGTSVGSGLDGAINWAVNNPIPVFLGIAGLFLLFREPPRSRR